MFLKNYTSNVPISETIHRIEQVLLQCGVTGIMKEYGLNQKVVAITFKLDTAAGPKAVRLPGKENEAVDALWKDYMGSDLLPDGKKKWSSRKNRSKKDFEDQGGRTAWRIVKDWVEVQMSMIQLGQADVLEVFLPYLCDGKRTYFDALKQSNYAGLLRNNNDDPDDGFETR